MLIFTLSLAIPMQIRQATTADLLLLQAIGRQTFAASFGEDNTAADMEQYLNEKFSTEQLSKELEHPESHFFFAEIEGEVIGYLKINTGTAQSEQILENALEIERIYVLAAYHGKGIGKQLFDKALEIAKAKDFHLIWLGVWEENPRAIRFYAKQGFVPFDTHIFVLGEDVQTDLLMKLVV